MNVLEVILVDLVAVLVMTGRMITGMEVDGSEYGDAADECRKNVGADEGRRGSARTSCSLYGGLGAVFWLCGGFCA
jgi:hypothetical protein